MTTPKQLEDLPVAVIGAGPIGLAAAAHLLADGLDPVVLEASPRVAGNIEQWAHVRLFSPWRYNIDAAAARLLDGHGWQLPDLDALPTGRDLIDLYLQPLAAVPALASRIHFASTVTAVTRDSADKVNHDRAKAPFAVHVRAGDADDVIFAKAIIDASGTWATPNPLGANGVPAVGELAASAQIRYGIPDVVGSDAARYAGRNVLVVGGGHSASNVILALIEVARTEASTRIHWVIRGDVPRAYGGGALDELKDRGALGTAVHDAVEAGLVTLHRRFRVRRIDRTGAHLAVSDGADQIVGIDQIVAATGQRPDLAMTRELRADLDPALESTRGLASLIDPNIHSCGTVRPHDYRMLAQPDPGLFIAGAKSYGRAPTFLLATGYEQARSISAHLAGDNERAERVHLVLPESGVCGGPGIESNGECC